MIQVYETNSGKRQYVGCSYTLAFQIWLALNAKGIKAFIIKLDTNKTVY